MTEYCWKGELENRLLALREALEEDPEFDTALITGRINQYYLTGTMQDALLVLQRGKKACLYVRRSYERAGLECPLPLVSPMASYRDILRTLSPDFGNTYIETELVPYAVLERWRKYFRMASVRPLDRVLQSLRAVKSEYELSCIRRAGALHKRLLEEAVPGLLREGMTEAEFHGEIYSAMMKMGHHGIARFSMFQAEMSIGQLGFGENSVYPTSFDGPGGMRGMGAAAPATGSGERKLRRGDLVFVDLGFGVEGYHSDKTQVYSFGAPPDPDVLRVHRACMDVQKRCAQALAAGAVPSDIYTRIMENLPECLSVGFMGYGQSVNFLGHGIGLHVDEPPVLAKGFREPLQENMVLAIEPKCGLPGVGTVGVEDTYVVTRDGGVCVTGGGIDILTV